MTNGLVLPPEARLVAGGLGFTEGPAFLDTGEVAVVSINRGTVYGLSLDGTAREIVETGGGPNCVAAGPDGELWIAQNGGTAMPSKSRIPAVASIQLLRDGVLTTAVSNGLNSPSDCEVGPDGRLWFTDPVGHMDSDKLGSLRSMDLDDFGLRTHRDDLCFPNGLAFGRDRSKLYVAETLNQRVRRYDVAGDAVEYDGWQVELPDQGPDGIGVDSEGWLWVACSTGDSVVAYDEARDLRATYVFGEGVAVTSVCFAGPGLDTIVVTIAKGGSVVALPAPNPGLPVPVWSQRSTRG